MRTPKLDSSDDGLINGPRSTPLRIHRHSHAIHKSSSFPALPLSPGKPKRPPVIIYTQSPKIIHTHAHDFMALVQKLTGLHRAEDDQSDHKKCANNSEDSGYDEENERSMQDSSTFSSMHNVCSKSNNDNSMNIPYLMDVTYLNPSTSDFLCSSMADHPISPSFMDLMKGLPDY
ncbi:VQ motif-containing protein 8- chloroplastic [Striga hermonthica]|uniref:VQ motif-containing protein 8- chloroplastic n=1 Tax=Striga hermonthica TaxID=68872 RepID=A0A9N7MF03_STRHE|nr:VQ motif-containing protein 8- chloroplastic [Striga hermonthica]